MSRFTKEQIVKLQKELKTDAQIGKCFGITRQAVHQFRKKYGIASQYAGIDERNKEIITQSNSGLKVPILAKKFDLSMMQIYAILRKEKNKKMVNDREKT